MPKGDNKSLVDELQERSEHRWNLLNKDAANRVNFSEYDKERSRQKKALKELLDEYSLALEDDPVFQDIMGNIKANLKIDATAQKKKDYKNERETYEKIQVALNNYLKLSVDEGQKLTKKRDKLTKALADATEKKAEQLKAEIKKLVPIEQRNESKLMIAFSLKNYYEKLSGGNLEIPDTDKMVKIHLDTKKGEEELKAEAHAALELKYIDENAEERKKKIEKEIKEKIDEIRKLKEDNKKNYNKDDYTYFVDATDVKFLGGFEDSAKKGSSPYRVSIKDIDAKDTPLFPHDPCMNDIAQGGLGDCWFVNAISTLAKQHPDMIRDMMKDNNDGTVTVRLYGNVPGENENESKLKPVYVRVDKKISKEKGIIGTNGVHGAENCLWVNMIERAASAIGLGTKNNIKLLPPDYKEKYDALAKQKKKGELTDDDISKNPWFFIKENNNEFTEFKPSFDAISGGRGINAIDMLMGEKYRGNEIDTTHGKYKTEIDTRHRIEKIVTDSTSIMNYVFKEMALSQKEKNNPGYLAKKDVEEEKLLKETDDLALLMDSTDVQKIMGENQNSYDKYADLTDGNEYVSMVDNKLHFAGAYNIVSDAQRNNKFDLVKIADEAFNKKREEIKKQKSDDKDSINEIDKFIDAGGHLELEGFKLDGQYGGYLVEKLTEKMKQLLDDNRSKFANTIEGNAELMKKVADEFEKKEIKKENLEKEAEPELKKLSDSLKFPDLDKVIKVHCNKTIFSDENDKVVENLKEAKKNNPLVFMLYARKRISDFDLEHDYKYEAFDKYVENFIDVAKKEMAANLRKLSELQKKATDNSEKKIGKLFEKIQKAVRHNVVLSAGVHHKKYSAEDAKTHVPSGHAYGIVGAYVDEKGQRFVTLRNPWGDYENNGIVYDKKGKPKLGHAKDGVFDLKFEDFFGQIDDISYNAYLDDLPEQPEKKAGAKVDKDVLTAEVGHSFQRLIRDSYDELMKTKTFWYKNTTDKFNNVILNLKEVYYDLDFCKGKKIGDEFGLKSSVKKLQDAIKEYQKHCENSKTSGKHKDRLAIVDELSNRIQACVKEDEVSDPRADKMLNVGKEMLKRYYKGKKKTVNEEELTDKASKLISTSTFKNMMDDKNYYTMDKIKGSELGKMMKEFVKIHNSPEGKKEMEILL